MPYLASVLFACPLEIRPGIGTVSVSRRWVLQADPEVIAQLTADQLGRLLIHLAAHLVRDHAGRAERAGVTTQERAERWNRCGDAEINDDLLADDCVPQVAPDLPADLGCAPGGLAEAYLVDAGDGPRRWDCGSGADGSPRPGDDPTGSDTAGLPPGDAELLRLGVAAEIHRLAREPGSVPGGWRRWAESVLPSRVDWRRLLAAEIRRGVAAVAGSVDYSYRRPSRRDGAARDVVLSTMVRPIPEVAVVCDTSGSMHDHLLARALAEVQGILTRAGVRELRVLAVDTDVHAVRRATRIEHVRLAGGGGTDMGAGVAAAAKMRPRPSVIVVLTDGYTPWPARPPAGIRVVVGLLADRGAVARPPAWARTVVIDRDLDS
jgi:predicted metal-dependent peptidase